jgi:diphosphomevalonate decarboxylase
MGMVNSKRGNTMSTATAQSHPNIALIKYWGNRDDKLRLPVNGSISMNLDGLSTRTAVNFESSLSSDKLIIKYNRGMAA